MRRSWHVLRPDASTTLVTADWWEVIGGALWFYNGLAADTVTVALYPRGEWRFMSQNVD